MTQISPLCRLLPTELIIAIATLLDAPSLVCFESTCKDLRNIVSQTPALKYVLALAARGLCDGPPSPVTAASRLELLETYDEAWRTFSWRDYLMLELPFPHEAPYVSGDTLVLPIYGMSRMIRSFVIQSIPSPLRGIRGRQWQIDLDFCVDPFIIDATQDLLVVVPRHDTQNVLVCTLSTGQPHPLSANGGVLHLEPCRCPAIGNSKHGISGDFLGMIMQSRNAFDDRLVIWNWKTGIIHLRMPIRVGNDHDAVFSFLDGRHFVVPSVISERPNEIVLKVFQHHGQEQQQQQPVTPMAVCSYDLDALTAVSSLRFFPDVSARCGASPGHFYADTSKREFGIQIEATCQSTQTTTVHELLVPIRALTTPRRAPSLPCRRVNVGYEPFLGRRLAHASRRAAEHQSAVSSDKLPVGLRDVGARQLRFAVCSGALLVFELGNDDPKALKKLHIFAF